MNSTASRFLVSESGLLKNRSRLALFIAIFITSLLVYLQFEPRHQPTGGDLSMWDYMAQSIIRGDLPYKDVVNIKTPLGAYLSAGAIVVGKVFAVRDIIAIRYLYILLASALSAMTYLLTEVYFQRRLQAIFASLIMLSYDSFGVWNASGSQVKTAALFFGMLSLYAIARERGVLAGVCGALAFWCWQPGLLFVGASGLVACKFLSKPLEKRAWAVAAGAIGTLFLGFAYFYFTGIWQDFYNWCFDFNTKANSSIKSTLGWVRAITIIRKSYPEEWFWFLLFVPGFFWYLVDIYKLIREMKTRLFLTSCWRLAPTVAFFAYGVFTFFNLQSGPDVIFFLPFVSMYAAYLFYNVLQLLDNVAATWPKKVLTLSISILLILKVVDAFFYNPKFTLQNEEAQWSSVVSQIGSGDRVYAQGSLDLLVLYNLPNASKYIYFDRGKDRYAAVVEGSFEKIIKDLTDKKPKFVALAKLERVEQRDSLMAWVKNFYQPFSEVSSTNSGINDSVFEYTVYKLKE